LRNVWLWTEFQETRRKGSGRSEVLQFEEEVESGSQRQDQVNRLEVAVCEVGSHLVAARDKHNNGYIQTTRNNNFIKKYIKEV